MLTVTGIINFLNSKQISINRGIYNEINLFEKIQQEGEEIETEYVNKHILEKYQYYLPDSFDIIFTNNKSFYYDSKLYKNRSPVFTFLNS